MTERNRNEESTEMGEVRAVNEKVRLDIPVVLPSVPDARDGCLARLDALKYSLLAISPSFSAFVLSLSGFPVSLFSSHRAV